ncbi:hypothetical protein MRX96_001381 [Rhipicephalus microplus]
MHPVCQARSKRIRCRASTASSRVQAGFVVPRYAGHELHKALAGPQALMWLSPVGRRMRRTIGPRRGHVTPRDVGQAVTKPTPAVVKQAVARIARPTS